MVLPDFVLFLDLLIDLFAMNLDISWRFNANLDLSPSVTVYNCYLDIVANHEGLVSLSGEYEHRASPFPGVTNSKDTGAVEI